jgi:hypothetical protein
MNWLLNYFISEKTDIPHIPRDNFELKITKYNFTLSFIIGQF